MMEAMNDTDLAAIILCPSNPFVSIDPILGLSGVRERLVSCGCPVIGVSPIIGGAAVKGPAARMLRDLGFDVSALAVAERYRDILDGFVIDTVDQDLAPRIAALGIDVEVTPTLMKSDADRRSLAEVCLMFARRLNGACF